METPTTKSTKHAVIVAVVATALAFFGASCTNKYYRKSADKAAYSAIKQKTPLVKNMDEHFTIEQTNKVSLDGLPKISTSADFLGQDGASEQGASVLSLNKALEIAVNHSRTYQTQKEKLYITALDLSAAQHAFAPIFGASGNANYQVTTANLQQTVVDPQTGSNIVVLSDNLAETHRINGSTTVGTDLLLATGGQLAVSFTTTFLRYLSGDQLNATGAKLAGTLTQPLWRGAGYKVTMENLTQSQRNLLYGIRDFTRFRKTFSVDIATAYYNVLKDRDEVRNSFVNLQNSRRNADRTRELAKEGRIAQADLGRLEQQELTSESTWVGAVVNYKRALDNFKIQIGLPTDERIVLDDQELAQLKIDHPEISVDDSIKVAMSMRLDYVNAREKVEDADRRIPVVANALRTKIDLVASGDIQSDSGKLLPNIHRYEWDAGLNLDLPLDRTLERNAYREAIITFEQTKRDLTLEEDQIKLDVRNSWRQLEQAKRAYEISKVGVQLAERRVEEQNLLGELGRAKAQDQVDAQNDLSASKNQYTQALVGHTVARLQFWDNLGILYIKNAGQWQEPNNAKIN